MTLAVRDLTRWMRENLEHRAPIRVSGTLRSATRSPGQLPSDPQTSVLIDALELNGVEANTVRLLAINPPGESEVPTVAEFQKRGEKQPKSDNQQKTENRGERKKDGDTADTWRKGWAKLLTASALLPPRVDSGVLAHLLRERRVIRLFCDTNALCSGVAEWLMHVLPTRTELLTSALVDKEVMAWADTNKNLPFAWTAADWEARLRFLLVRRLTIYPPRDTIIEPRSPDQNALMLAHGTDKNGRKAPGADLLFIELARPLIREQPRQARVVFVTGDANLAGAATGALGPEHVLYANPDHEALRNRDALTLARGFWHPAMGLGRVTIPSPGRLLWTMFAAFDRLLLTQGDRCFSMTLAERVRHGCPTDWADPWLQIEPGPPPPRTTTALIPSSDDSGSVSTSAAPDLSDRPVREIPATSAESPTAERASDSSPRTHGGSFTKTDWLLAPPLVETQLDALSASPRPNAKHFFSILSDLHAGTVASPPEGEVAAETHRVLQGLGVIEADGRPGPMAADWRAAWDRNDLDWMHAQLHAAHPGYRAVLDLLRAGRQRELTSRQNQFLPLMRALGQVARVPTRSAPIRVGDAPVDLGDLDAALHRWLAHPGDALPIATICERAIEELRLTPHRFELALAELWRRLPDYDIAGMTSGAAEPTSSEPVVELRSDGTWRERPVSPGALMFGRTLPTLFLARRS